MKEKGGKSARRRRAPKKIRQNKAKMKGKGGKSARRRRAPEKIRQNKVKTRKFENLQKFLKNLRNF